MSKLLLKRIFIIVVFCCFSYLPAHTQTTKSVKNLVYAEIGSRKLLVDIYLPSEEKTPFLIVWIHGGAWHSGSKENPPLELLSSGYAIASVDFRLSTEAPFPAQVHDIKAAIRFLRGNAKTYGYRSDKIIIWGCSSGGHLAALVGTTNSDTYMEGNEGNFLKESSSVQGIIDYYGPTNFLTILNQSTPHGLSVRAPALAILLGKPLDQAEELAKKASTVFQMDANDPPLLIVHGEQDIQVPINQSLELMNVYKKNSLPVQFEVIPGAAHGGNEFYKGVGLQWMKDFLQKILK